MTLIPITDTLMNSKSINSRNDNVDVSGVFNTGHNKINPIAPSGSQTYAPDVLDLELKLVSLNRFLLKRARILSRTR